MDIEIARPRAEVAAFAADPDNVTRWYANIEAVAWLTPRPLARGTRMEFAAGFLGRRLAYVYEVLELVPGERLLMATEQGPFPIQTTYEWADRGPQATRMSLRNRGRPAGFRGVAAPVMSAAVRRANRRDLELLKRVLEDA